MSCMEMTTAANEEGGMVWNVYELDDDPEATPVSSSIDSNLFYICYLQPTTMLTNKRTNDIYKYAALAECTRVIQQAIDYPRPVVAP
jgi:hypothetical protein